MRLRNLLNKDYDIVFVTLAHISTEAINGCVATVYNFDNLAANISLNPDLEYHVYNSGCCAEGTRSELNVLGSAGRVTSYKASELTNVRVQPVNGCIDPIHSHFVYSPFLKTVGTQLTITKNLKLRFGCKRTDITVDSDRDAINGLGIPVNSTRDIKTITVYARGSHVPIPCLVHMTRKSIKILLDRPLLSFDIEIRRGSTNRTVLETVKYKGTESIKLSV